MFAGKPIIGLSGGIGSGKSFIARHFGEFGGLVLSADDQVRQAYSDPAVQQTLRQWWGDSIFNSAGEIQRKSIAAIVFNNPAERQRLEALLHPMVDLLRQSEMQAAANDPRIVAYIWDVPLLFEVGLDARCDALVFVEAPLADRLERVKATRGWDEAELARREKLQLGLDNKRRMSKYSVQNTADVGFARQQVEAVLKQILAASTTRAHSEPGDTAASQPVD